MTCRDVQCLAGSYLDGELPEEMCDRIQRHLLRCGPCREEVESLRFSVEVLKSTHPAPAVGEEFVQRSLGALRRDLGIEVETPGTPGQLVLEVGS
jgi:anti-sigma factor RsiW